MQAIAELLAGLLVELYREFQQWWLGRARLRTAAPPAPAEPSPLPDVEPLVAELLVRHASRQRAAIDSLRGAMPRRRAVAGRGSQDARS
jgi:hypothetical protein